MAFSKDDPNSSLLLTLNLTVTILSLIGSAWMTFYCSQTQRKNVSTKLILVLAIADFFYSISNLLSTFEGDDVNLTCRVEAFLRGVSYSLSTFMTCSIVIYCVIFLNKDSNINQINYYRSAIAISIVISLAIALSPFYIPELYYSNSPLICRIFYAPEGPGTLGRILPLLFVLGIPMILPIFINIVGYIYVIIKVKRLSGEFYIRVRKSLNKVMWFPLVLIITFVPVLTDSFREAFTNAPSPLVIQIMHIIFTHLLGFSNAIVYGIQRRQNESRRAFGRSWSASSSTSGITLL